MTNELTTSPMTNELAASAPREDNLKAADDYLNAELTAGWSKKLSLETRAFAVIAVNTGIATLYIAVQAQFGLAAPKLPGLSKGLLIAGLIVSVLSIGCSVLACVPTRFREPTKSDLIRLLKQALDPTHLLTRADIIRTRIAQYEKLSESNTRKAYFVFAAFIFLGIFAACMIVALVVANNISRIPGPP